MHEIVYTQDDFLEPFKLDLDGALSFVYIQSPYATTTGVERLRTSLEELVKRGIRVCVFLQELYPTSQLFEQAQLGAKMLESMGVHVCIRKKIHSKVVVIDSFLLYDGSLNVLSYNPQSTTERMTRKPNIYQATAAIILHKLDHCPQCFALPQSPSNTVLTDVKGIGQIIADMRKAQNQSQGELATRAGVCRSTLIRIEAGLISPQFDTLLKVCRALNVNLAILEPHAIPFLEQFKRMSSLPPG